MLAENTVLIGVREIDAAERENIRRAGIAVYTMRDIDERGMRAVMEEALRATGQGTAGYHVSMDMDWIDPEDAPVWARRCVAERPTARRTWPWRSLPTTGGC
jgi:arginase